MKKQPKIRIYQLTPPFTASGADQYSLANRSNALRKQGELEAALRDAERAIHLRPEWAKGYYREGEALAKLGRHEEVRERTLFSTNG